MNARSGLLEDPAWLPGVDQSIGAETRHEGTTVVGASFTAPVLDGRAAADVAETARRCALAARESYRVSDVVTAVAAAASRLVDPADRYGAAAIEAVCRASGCGAEAAAGLIRENAKGWTASALTQLIESEFGRAGVLDGALRDGPSSRRRRAVGPPLLHLVLAGNVPGIAVTAVIRCLLVRSGVLCKLPSGEPWLVGLFARALDESHPELARSIAATWWPTPRTEADGDMLAEATDAVADVWAKQSGKVIVYGGDEAVRAYRARTPPTTPLEVYGPRLGVILLGSAATDREFAGVARDTFAYDQAGCVSPRLVYVLGGSRADGVDPAMTKLVHRLAVALSDAAADLAPGRLTDGEAVSIREARSGLQFDARGGEVHGPDDLGWTILYQPRFGTYSEPLPRVLWVYAAGSVEELDSARSVLEGRIQAMGIAGLEPAAEARAQELAVELGVSRVTRPGDMAWPPPDWRHDGRMQLLPLVRWTDLELGPTETTEPE